MPKLIGEPLNFSTLREIDAGRAGIMGLAALAQEDGLLVGLTVISRNLTQAEAG